MIYYTIHLYIAELLSALTSINKKGNPKGFEGLSYKSYNIKISLWVILHLRIRGTEELKWEPPNDMF